MKKEIGGAGKRGREKKNSDFILINQGTLTNNLKLAMPLKENLSIDQKYSPFGDFQQSNQPTIKELSKAENPDKNSSIQRKKSDQGVAIGQRKKSKIKKKPSNRKNQLEKLQGTAHWDRRRCWLFDKGFGLEGEKKRFNEKERRQKKKS